MKLRLSIIDFLNAVPLQWGFTHGSCQGVFQLLSDVPSACARHLRNRQADVGLIPVIEYQRIPGLRVLPGISIASKREVKSVLFVSRKPIEEVETIAVDTSSRTSAALLRILLSEFYGNPKARFFDQPPHPRQMLQDCQAALIIGNPALHVDAQGLIVYDLAHEWHRFTGLPFVFAFWAVGKGVDLGRQTELFYRSKDEGGAQIEQISRLYAERLGLAVQEVRDYLTGNLDYSLDEENLRGLDAYFGLAAKWGLIDQPQPLRFCQAEGIAQLHAKPQKRNQRENGRRGNGRGEAGHLAPGARAVPFILPDS